MTDNVSVIAERLRERRAAVRAALDAQPGHDTDAIAVGARVFDTASGLDGTVTGAGLTDRLMRGDVRVQLDDGRSVVRPATELIVRPALG